MRAFAIFCSAVILFSATQAQAGPKPWPLSWWPGHWDGLDFKPYLEDAKAPHNEQWAPGLYANEDWHPENWIRAKGSIEAVMDDFYKTEVIVEQDVDDNMPVLVVGDTFMNLSTQEKQRVTGFIDYVYQVTTTAPAGMYTIYYERTDNWIFGRGDPIGIYGVHGLFLQ